MAMANDDLVAIRQQRLIERANRLVEERSNLIEQHRDTRNDISRNAANGDSETAKYYDEVAEGIEQQIQTIDLELQQYTPQSGQITQAKVDYLNKHADNLNRAHWSGVTTNLGAIAYGHDQALAMGLQEDSPEYFALIDKIAPAGESALPSADEAARISGVDPKTYNSGVRRLIHEKQRGIK
jgi:hypothetical protein